MFTLVKATSLLVNVHYYVLVYTTQVNSTFRVRWLASSDVISQVLFSDTEVNNF